MKKSFGEILKEGTLDFLKGIWSGMDRPTPTKPKRIRKIVLPDKRRR